MLTPSCTRSLALSWQQTELAEIDDLLLGGVSTAPLPKITWTLRWKILVVG